MSRIGKDTLDERSIMAYEEALSPSHIARTPLRLQGGYKMLKIAFVAGETRWHFNLMARGSLTLDIIPLPASPPALAAASRADRQKTPRAAPHRGRRSSECGRPAPVRRRRRRRP